jgi:hypothetical protein
MFNIWKTKLLRDHKVRFRYSVDINFFFAFVYCLLLYKTLYTLRVNQFVLWFKTISTILTTLAYYVFLDFRFSFLGPSSFKIFS